MYNKPNYPALSQDFEDDQNLAAGVSRPKPPPTTQPPPTRPTPPPKKGYAYPEPEDEFQLSLAAGQSVQLQQPAKKPTTTTTEEPNQEGLQLDAEALQILQEQNEDGQYHPDADHTHWDIRKSIPGDPGKDYPTLPAIPETGFSCDGRPDGYYADVETGCQVYHVCASQAIPVKNSFLCNNGSIFNQERFVCDWWPNVDCPNSERSFDLNLEIGKTPNSIASDGSSSKSYSGSYNAGSASSSGSAGKSTFSSGGSYNAASSSSSAAAAPSSSVSGSGGSFGSGGKSSFSSGGSYNAGSASPITFPSTVLSIDSGSPLKTGSSAVPSGSGASFSSSGNAVQQDNEPSIASSLSGAAFGSSFSASGSGAQQDSEPSIAASLSGTGFGSSSSSTDADEQSLASVFGELRGSSASSSQSSRTEGNALSYPGPSAGFSPDIATGGIDLRVGFSSSGSASSSGKARRLSPEATSSLRASFARSSRQNNGGEALETASSGQGVVAFGERLGSRVSNSAVSTGPAKDLEAPAHAPAHPPTYKRKRLVARRRRVPSHEANRGTA